MQMFSGTNSTTATPSATTSSGAKDSPNSSDPAKFRAKSVQSGIKLPVAAKNFLSLLEELDRYHQYLSTSPAINNAIRRYETIWLPLAASHNGLLGPPIDVHLVWCVHMMSPISYKQDCLSCTNKLVDHRCLSLKDLQKARESSRKAWSSKFPQEPFDFDPNSSANLDLLEYSSQLAHTLRESIQKQLQFFYQVSLGHFQDHKFLEEAVSRYKKYIFLQLQNPEQVMIPLIDVTLIWHCHKVHPSVYNKDTKCSIDKLLMRNSAKPDWLWMQTTLLSNHNSSGLQGLDNTCELWYLVFKEKYLKTGTQHRGRSFRGKISCINLSDSYLISTKSAQVQVKSVLIEPHLKLDKYTVQLTNPLVFLHSYSSGIANGSSNTAGSVGSIYSSGNYMAKLKSPDKFWPNKPGHKFITNTTLVTGTVDTFTMELIDRRGLFCASNALLATKKICLLEHIENFLGTEYQNIDLQFDLGKDKDTALGRINISLVLFPPERHAARLKVLVGENAVLRVPLGDASFWGPFSGCPLARSFCGVGASGNNTVASAAIIADNSMTNSISSSTDATAVECYFLSHSIINHVKKEVLTVRIIHCLSMEKSMVQVLYLNQIVAVAETVGAEQLPNPNSIQASEIPVMETSKGERGLIIKDNEGDWGFFIGRWQQSNQSANRHGSVVNNTGLVNGNGNLQQYNDPLDEFARFSLRAYWLRGEKRVQYSHIPDSMNSWSVVLNDVSFDLSNGEIHISRLCNDIPQSVCLAFSCAVCLALCKPYYPPDWNRSRHSNSIPPEIKPPSDTFNTSLFLSPNIEVVNIPQLKDHLIRKKNSSGNFIASGTNSSSLEDPSRLHMCIAVGINSYEYLPSLLNIRHKRTVNKVHVSVNTSPDHISND